MINNEKWIWYTSKIVLWIFRSAHVPSEKRRRSIASISFMKLMHGWWSQAYWNISRIILALSPMYLSTIALDTICQTSKLNKTISTVRVQQIMMKKSYGFILYGLYLQEITIQLTCDSPSQQGLSRSRRSIEQAAFRWFHTNAEEQFWIRQGQLDHL